MDEQNHEVAEISGDINIIAYDEESLESDESVLEICSELNDIERKDRMGILVYFYVSDSSYENVVMKSESEYNFGISLTLKLARLTLKIKELCNMSGLEVLPEARYDDDNVTKLVGIFCVY